MAISWLARLVAEGSGLLGMSAVHRQMSIASRSLGMLWLLLQASLAGSAPLVMNYSGRVVDINGAPFAGPVNLKVRFFDAKVEGNQLGSDFVFSETILQEGIFQIALNFPANELGVIFSEQNETWIHISDLTHGIEYERQVFNAVPFALRIPVDGQSLKFSQTDGRLQVNELKQLKLRSSGGNATLSPHPGATGEVVYSLPRTDGQAGHVLSTDGKGQLDWSDPNAGGNPLDSNADNIADRAADAAKLDDKNPSYYLDMDHMQDGQTKRVFTAAEKNKLAALANQVLTIDATTVGDAGAVMESDLPNTAGFVRTDGANNLTVDTNVYLSSETDAKVGSIATAGKWCRSDGSVINCDQDAPLSPSNIGTGSNNLVQLDGSGKLPAVDGSQLTNLNLESPGVIGSATENTGAFTNAAVRGLRLNHDHDAETSNYMTLQAPDLGNDATTYTLPAVPVDGGYLTTDSSGNMSWASPLTSINADNITGTLDEARFGSSMARVSDVYLNEAALTSQLDDNYQALNAHLTDLADGELTGSKVAAGINADHITTGTIAAANIADSIARKTDVYENEAELKADLDDNYQALNEHLTDLSDGTLSGSKIGTGINANNITSGTIPAANIADSIARFIDGDRDNSDIKYNQVSDLTDELNAVYQGANAHLSDLADGSLSGSKITGTIDGSRITSGTIPAANIDDDIARDSQITYKTESDLTTALNDDYHPLDANEHLDDLADGELTGSKVGAGIDASLITGKVPHAIIDSLIARKSAVYESVTELEADLDSVYIDLDADLTDLADGTLSGDKIASGLDAAKFTTGNLPNSALPATISKTTLTASNEVTAEKFEYDCPTVSGRTIVKLKDSNGHFYGCMDAAVRTDKHWNEAMNKCRESGGRLVTAQEFQIANRMAEDGDISISNRAAIQWTAEGFTISKSSTNGNKVIIAKTYGHSSSTPEARCFYDGRN